jgi:solute carrier family 6 amino acid transporter-like protein 5/7/9/14
MLILAGKPIYFMELAFGQFAGVGPLAIWNCVPLAKGKQSTPRWWVPEVTHVLIFPQHSYQFAQNKRSSSKVGHRSFSVSGVGWAMVTVSLIVCVYYNVIMSYTMHYFISSMMPQVPWSVCDPAWADMSTCFVDAAVLIFHTNPISHRLNLPIIPSSSWPIHSSHPKRVI